MNRIIDIQVNELSGNDYNQLISYIDQDIDTTYIILNGLYEDLCHECRSRLYGIIDQDRIKVWNCYVDEYQDESLFHEWYISQLNPDEVICFSRLEDGTLTFENIDYVAKSCDEFLSEILNKSHILSDRQQRCLAKSIADSTLNSPICNVYIDISDMVTIDFVTGIQRVCIALIENITRILENDERYMVVPVYAEPCKNLYIKCDVEGNNYKPKVELAVEDIVQFHDGDYLIMPDVSVNNVATKVTYLKRLHNRGVRVFTLLHDIIPIRFPEYYSNDHVEMFTKYAKAISQFSGIVANSKATMDDYSDWLKEQGITTTKDFQLTYFHLGCDFDRSGKTDYKEDEDRDLLDSLKGKTTFLMVATIEPRKMHEQVLGAFEILWNEGIDVNLIFVGKYGWQMEAFAARLNKHPERNKRFFWFQGISDAYLQDVYNVSDAVIVASVTEGFGLPIIEAAHYGKALIVRDIPVFREVAGDGGFYFVGNESVQLSRSICEWMKVRRNKDELSTKIISQLSWKDSSRCLLIKVGII